MSKTPSETTIDEKILELFSDNFEDIAEHIIDSEENLGALGMFTKAVIENSVEDLLKFRNEYMILFNELTQKDF